jgi:hypothetical protein
VATWADFEAGAPELAAVGQRTMERDGISQGLLATMRGEGLPRIHPIYVAVVGGRLYAFLLESAKRRDLELDGRYALHAHQDPHVPNEFELRGRARLVEDRVEQDIAARAWSFEVDEAYALFELRIESALIGFRESADAWPPRYASWTPEGGSREAKGR